MKVFSMYLVSVLLVSLVTVQQHALADETTASSSVSAAPRWPSVYVTSRFKDVKVWNEEWQANFLFQVWMMCTDAGVKDTATVVTIFKLFNTTVPNTDSTDSVYNVVIKIDDSPSNPEPGTIASAVQTYLTQQYAPTDDTFDRAVITQNDPSQPYSSGGGVVGALSPDTPQNAATSSSTHTGLPVYVIVCVAFGFVALVCIAVLVCVWRRQSKKDKQQFRSTTERAIPASLGNKEISKPIPPTSTSTSKPPAEQPESPSNRNYMTNPAMLTQPYPSSSASPYPYQPSSSPSASPPYPSSSPSMPPPPRKAVLSPDMLASPSGAISPTNYTRNARAL